MSTASVGTADAAPSAGRPPAAGGDANDQSTNDQHTDGRSARRWWALAVIGLAQLMVVLDATIVNIALPSAQKALAFDNDGRQWIVTAYSLAFGSLLLLGGRLADLFGRRRTFLIGLVGFGAASALGGAAQDFRMLVVARALQGVFGAVLAPSALSLLTTTFTDVKDRSKAFGIFGAIAGSGGAIGLLLGGVLTEHLNWRWTLYVNVVIAVFAVLGALAFVRSRTPTERPRLDLPGTVLVGGGLFCIVYGFSNAETHDWDNWMCWAFLAAGGVLVTLFLITQALVKHPLLPLRVLGDRNRAGSYFSVFISGAGMFGVFLFLTYYLQTTLGYSPVKTGLGFLPMVGMLMATAQLATNLLVPRIGPKPIVPVGMALAAGGLVLLTRLDLDSTYAQHVLPSLLMLGLGLGLVMPPAMTLATLGVARHDQGVASATVNTMQQVGGSIGTALFNTMAASAATDYAKDHFGEPRLAAKASLHSYATAYWWAAGFFAVGFVVALLLYRRGRPLAHTPAAPEETVPEETEPSAAGAPVEAATPAGAPAAVAVESAAPSGTALRGQVRTGGGASVPGAVVTLIDTAGRQLARSTAGPDGRYGLDAPAGTYVLVGSAPGHQPQVATVTVGGSPAEFDLRLGGTGGVTGRVLAAGEPVEGALVVATDERGDVAASTTTGEDGTYRLGQLVAGGYTLTVSARGHQPSAELVELADSTPVRHDAELKRAATIRGKVRNSGGRPVEDARVDLYDAAGNSAGRQITGSDGGYAFTDLPGGKYTVVASTYPPVSHRIAVDGPHGDDLDITLGYED